MSLPYKDFTRLAEKVRDIALSLAPSSGSAPISESISSSETYLQLDNWDKIAGNTIEYTYYLASTPATDPDNPSGNAGSLATEVYKDVATATVLTKTYSYNASDELIKITAS